MARALWFASALALAATTASAQQDVPAGVGGWRLCNATSYIVDAATARSEGEAVVVKGWMRLRPGECRVAVAAPLEPGVYFVHARSIPAYSDGRRVWRGPQTLCVRENARFEIEGRTACNAIEDAPAGFRPVLVEDVASWRTELAEVDHWTLEEARAAGLQRLLRETGQTTVRIDGIPGRRLMRSLSAFGERNDLSGDASENDYFDALAEAAIARRAETGVEVCNRTAGQIWAAFAWREERWISRGWWSVAPNACRRVLETKPKGEAIYVKADRMGEAGAPDLRLSGATERFCIAEGLFEIERRDGCTQRGFDTAGFRAFPADVTGPIVIELYERDFALPAAAP